MIFVTVGTTLFDELVAEVDRLCTRGFLTARVVCQIGSGAYEPKHCESFRFAPSLGPWYEQADLVICHGGTGTVCELLALGKPFVPVANTRLAGDHQSDFLAVCAQRFGIAWCRGVGDLAEAVRRVRPVKPHGPGAHHLGDDLRLYLDRIRPHGRRTSGRASQATRAPC